MFKINCSRCSNGTGYIKAYAHVQGGVCFKCGGTGYTTVKTDPEKLSKAKRQRKEAREMALRERMAAGQKIANAREEKYKNDPRIGPKTKASCERSEAYAYETYKALENIDTGKYLHGLGNIAE